MIREVMASESATRWKRVPAVRNHVRMMAIVQVIKLVPLAEASKVVLRAARAFLTRVAQRHMYRLARGLCTTCRRFSHVADSEEVMRTALEACYGSISKKSVSFSSLFVIWLECNTS